MQAPPPSLGLQVRLMGLPSVSSPPQLGTPQKQAASGATKPAPEGGGIASVMASSGSTRSPLSTSHKTFSEEPTPTGRSQATGSDPDCYQLMVGDVGAWSASVWGKDAMTPIAPLGATKPEKPACGAWLGSNGVSSGGFVGVVGTWPADDYVPTTAAPALVAPPPRDQANLPGSGGGQGRAAEPRLLHTHQWPLASSPELQLPPSSGATSPAQGLRPGLTTGARAAAGESARNLDPAATGCSVPARAHADQQAAPHAQPEGQARPEHKGPPPAQLSPPLSGGSCRASACIVLSSAGRANFEAEAARQEPARYGLGSSLTPMSPWGLDTPMPLIGAATNR